MMTTVSRVTHYSIAKTTIQSISGTTVAGCVKKRPKRMKYDHMYMRIAEACEAESQCPRLHVGCAIVLESGIIAAGFNGMASGGPNQWPYEDAGNPEVVHAELNALGKCLEEGLSVKGATAYVTCSCCLDCAKLLVRAKVKRVVYRDAYRKEDGLDYLKKYNVEVYKL